jgi:hypothetical protein
LDKHLRTWLGEDYFPILTKKINSNAQSISDMTDIELKDFLLEVKFAILGGPGDTTRKYSAVDDIDKIYGYNRRLYGYGLEDGEEDF